MDFGQSRRDPFATVVRDRRCLEHAIQLNVTEAQEVAEEVRFREVPGFKWAPCSSDE
jgi:hypothetical protein